MQVTVDVSKPVLEWVVATVPLDMLPQKISALLDKWLLGEKKPTYNQIEKVSKATGVPLGYFFMKNPPKEEIALLDYRTVDSVSLENPSRNLIDTIHDMEQVQDWVRQHQISSGSELPLVGMASEQASLSEFASAVRGVLNIAEDWYTESRNAEESFRRLRQAMSDAGVIVMMNGIVGNNTHRKLQIEEFRAFAMVDEYAPLIFINSRDSVNGRLFSLVHEFAHICIGKNSFFNKSPSADVTVSNEETLCNRLAAEILVPLRILEQEWEKAIAEGDTESAITSLAQKFRCGVTVIARRALDSGYINKERYFKIARDAVDAYKLNNEKKKSAGGDYYRTAASRIDSRFFNMLNNSVAEGKTLYTDAFRLTNTNRSTYANLSKEMGWK